MVKSMWQYHMSTTARQGRTRKGPLWKQLSERATFRSVPVQVWYGNVMYKQLDCWKKIVYYFEKCLSHMKFLSTDVPLTDAKLIYIPL